MAFPKYIKNAAGQNVSIQMADGRFIPVAPGNTDYAAVIASGVSIAAADPIPDPILMVLSTYRDEMINSGTITYEGVSSLNDQRSRSAIREIRDQYMLDTDMAAVVWDGPSGTQSMTGKHAQGLSVLHFNHQQACFAAFATVKAAHAITPYVTIEAAKTAFDTALSNQ